MNASEMIKSRSRISSQDSLHSNPKTWLDFEQENRTWRVSIQIENLERFRNPRKKPEIQYPAWKMGLKRVQVWY